ncbi:MAG: histidine phosphatase family protein [Kangiellaceae bacterium]|nr:histidine phosphatase family protein [Kangiellaceae bacterium]
MSKWFQRILVLVLSFSIASCVHNRHLTNDITQNNTPAFSIADCDNYTVYLVRHLQKDLSVKSSDPDLSSVGHQNAQLLSKMPFIESVQAGFHSQFKRTKRTLTPSAKFGQFPLTEYDARNGQALADLVAQQYCGQTLIISGHSNTIPDLVQKFGGKFDVSYAGMLLDKQPHISLSEQDYGSVFMVKNINGRINQQVFTIK